MRVTSSAIVAIVTVTVACSDSTLPPTASSSRISDAVASAFPIAKATVRVLSGLDGFTATAINDSDEVVGYTGAAGSRRAFRWTPAKGLAMLTRGDNSEARAAAVNDNGAIAGSGADTVIAADRAVVWFPNGTIRDLPLYPDSLDTESAPNGCAITGMNIYAQIVGTCIAHSFPIATKFAWHGSPMPASDAEYSSISNDGWIGGAGDDEEENIGPPFIISPTGQSITLKGHDGQAHSKSAVNAVTMHGWAAGYSSEGGCQQAVAWLAATGQSYPEFRMGVCGQANGLTHDWYVVGTASDSALDASKDWAFVWFPGAGTQRLPGLGGTGEISTAVAVSAIHHVLGTITSGGTTHVVIWSVAPRS